MDENQHTSNEETASRAGDPSHLIPSRPTATSSAAADPIHDAVPPPSGPAAAVSRNIPPTWKTITSRLEPAEAGSGSNVRPRVSSFREFLARHARVRLGEGRFGPYTFAGREALRGIVDTIDEVLGSNSGRPLADASIDICGGAQFGKTILALNLGAYLTGVLFRNWGYYLPDDDLVEGIVDGKFRPDVIDQIEWLAESITLGKTLTRSGRAAHRKGAFMVVWDGRVGLGMIRGMGKIPTSFSMDVVMEDEKDDIDPRRSKYLRGRMTSSDLRLKMSIGTQRLHGAGQHKQFLDGSQHVMMLADGRGRRLNPEEHWPQICRLAVTGVPRPDDPMLTWEGDFKPPGRLKPIHSSAAPSNSPPPGPAGSYPYRPDALYYLANPEDGAPLDRRQAAWEARRPERMTQRRWSFRVSQLGIAAIGLGQLVSAWQEAIADAEDMAVFCCDRLALPKSPAQMLTPKILERARGLEEFEMGLSLAEHCAGYGGLDTGDRCWLFVREIQSAAIKRARYVEQIAAGNVVSRAAALFHLLRLEALFVDARPLINEARTLCFLLNGVQGIAWPRLAHPESALIELPGGLAWDGPSGRWRNLRCAVVEFTLKPGQGIRHKLGQCDEQGQTRFYPIIQCCRFDAIDRVVNEFLTAEENVVQVIEGRLRAEPVMRLPRKAAGRPSLLDTLEAHLITGSQRQKDTGGALGDYVDGVENHLLLADAYSALAEAVSAGSRPSPFAYQPVPVAGPGRIGRHKGVLV